MMMYPQHLRKLLKLLHERDSRRPFCLPGHWVSHVLHGRLNQVCPYLLLPNMYIIVDYIICHLPLQMPANIFEVDSVGMQLFHCIVYCEKAVNSFIKWCFLCFADESPSPASSQSVLRMRNFLKQTPFVFSFTERVKVSVLL